MKIKQVDVFVQNTELDAPLLDARSVIVRRQSVLVRVRTEEGVGWGEAAAFGGVADLVVSAIKTLAPLIVGSPASPIDLKRDLLQASAHYGIKGVVRSAISGIEIACWDVLAKRANVGVATVMGSSTRPMPIYGTSGFYTSREATASLFDLEGQLSAIDLAQLSGVKIKIGRFGLADDLARTALARSFIGPSMRLIVDANNALDLPQAVRFAHSAEQYDITFLEEPLPFEHLDASRSLRSRTTIPVAGYEIDASLDAVERQLELDATDVVQPDAIWSGGISEIADIASRVRRAGKSVVLHNFASAVSTMANYHAACIADSACLEIDATRESMSWGELRASGLLENGMLDTGHQPGLGWDPRVDSATSAAWSSS